MGVIRDLKLLPTSDREARHVEERFVTIRQLAEQGLRLNRIWTWGGIVCVSQRRCVDSSSGAVGGLFRFVTARARSS
jgi:hypothetical protein